MQNGRFARNVVERAERLRDSRVAAQHRTDKGSVTVEDLETSAHPGHRRGRRGRVRGKACAGAALSATQRTRDRTTTWMKNVRC